MSIPESVMEGFINLVDDIKAFTSSITHTSDMLSMIPVSLLLNETIWASNALQLSSNHLATIDTVSLNLQSHAVSVASNVQIIASNLDTMLFDQAEIAKHNSWMEEACVYTSNGINTYIKQGGSMSASWSSNYGVFLSNLVDDTRTQMGWLSNILSKTGTPAEIVWASNIGTGAYTAAVAHSNQLAFVSTLIVDVSNAVCWASNNVGS